MKRIQQTHTIYQFSMFELRRAIEAYLLEQFSVGFNDSIQRTLTFRNMDADGINIEMIITNAELNVAWPRTEDED